MAHNNYEVTEPKKLDDFVSATQMMLQADSANNTVVLSIIQAQLKVNEVDSARPLRMLTVTKDGVVVGAGIRNRPDTMAFSAMPKDAAIAIGQFIKQDPSVCDEAAGPERVIDAICSVVTNAQQAPAKLRLELMLYCISAQTSLGANTANRGPSNCLVRPATMSDQDWLVTQIEEFHSESGAVLPPTPISELVAKRIEDGSFRIAYDANDQPLALAGFNLLPCDSARVGPVFTVKNARGAGVAQALVADLTTEVFSKGTKDVFLFTDASYPASNKCYQRVGFVYQCNHRHLIFR
jgi:predicted GNAT family acetyltransferase